MALSFLLSCADPSGGPVGEVILDGEPEHDRATLADYELSSSRALMSDTIDPRLLVLGFVGPSFDAALKDDGADFTQRQETLNRLHLNTSDAKLGAQVCLLAADLQQVSGAMTKFKTSPNLAAFPAFFTAENFRDCISAFFQRVHLLASTIHLPTLHLSLFSPALFLSTALAGFSYHIYGKESPFPASFTTTLQELAEEYIFRFMDSPPGAGSYSTGSREALELFQAAYLIMAL